MTTTNQLKIEYMTIDKQDSSDTIKIFVHYTWNGERKTDNGRLFVFTGGYYPAVDMDDSEDEYYALQEMVEASIK